MAAWPQARRDEEDVADVETAARGLFHDTPAGRLEAFNRDLPE